MKYLYILLSLLTISCNESKSEVGEQFSKGKKTSEQNLADETNVERKISEETVYEEIVYEDGLEGDNKVIPKSSYKAGDKYKDVLKGVKYEDIPLLPENIRNSKKQEKQE